MIIGFIVKCMGGIWELRRRYHATGSTLMKKALLFLYTWWLKDKSSWISMSAIFEGAPCFPHGIYGIFISGGARIGRNCIIFHQVTIGSNTLIDSKMMGSPVMGENCYMGSGAKVIGKVTVGNNVRIGANAVVYKDVPDNSVVACGAQTVLERNQPLNNNFYHRYKGRWEFFHNGTWKSVERTDELARLDHSFPLG